MRYRSLFMSYFVQTFTFDFIAVGLAFYWAEVVGPDKIPLYWMLLGLPWVIKPVYGLFTDSIPIFGYRRRPWISIASLFASLSFLFLTRIIEVVYACTFASLFLCISDVVSDSLLVELSRTMKTEGLLQSNVIRARLYGSVVALSGGLVYQLFGIDCVFQIAAILPIALSVSIFALPEKKYVQDGTPIPIGVVCSSIANGFSWPLARILSVGCLVGLLPNRIEMVLFYRYKEVHFSPFVMSIIAVAGAMGGLVGVILYKKIKGVRRPMIISGMLTTAGCIIGSYTVGLTDYYAIFVGAVLQSLFFGISNSLLLIPLITTTATLMPKNAEGTMYALVMSMFNSAAMVGDVIESFFVSELGITSSSFKNKNLFNFTMISALITLVATFISTTVFVRNDADCKIQSKLTCIKEVISP